MENPHRGEVAITLDGQEHVARLSLGALVMLEVQVGSILDLVTRFEQGQARAEDVLLVLHTGLAAEGWPGSLDDLRAAEVSGGYLEALQSAAQLLQRSFSGNTA